MPLSRCALKAFSVALLFLSVTVVAPAQSISETNQQADKEDASEQRAIEQLRAIAQSVRKCPGSHTTSAWGSVTVTAPMNVTWDIEQRQSLRSPKIGFIEFTTKKDCTANLNLETCKRKDWDCEGRNQAALMIFNKDMESCSKLKPNQYRYEFDLGRDGLEFVQALSKPEAADRAQWTATSLEHGCVEDAILSILNHPSEPSVDSSSVTATPAQLQVTSTPNGADIEIDGSFVGNTPSTVGVTAGQHDISVKRIGFKPWSRKIAISSGQVNVNAVLEPEHK